MTSKFSLNLAFDSLFHYKPNPILIFLISTNFSIIRTQTDTPNFNHGQNTKKICKLFHLIYYYFIRPLEEIKKKLQWFNLSASMLFSTSSYFFRIATKTNSEVAKVLGQSFQFLTGWGRTKQVKEKEKNPNPEDEDHKNVITKTSSSTQTCWSKAREFTRGTKKSRATDWILTGH